MDHVGIDVRKRDSQIYILAEGGGIIEHRIRTEPERFAALLGSRPRGRILIEASTGSERVARRLAGILYALRRDGRVFEPQRARHPPRPAAAPAPVGM